MGPPKSGTLVQGEGKQIDIKTVQVSKRGSDDPQERFAQPPFNEERAIIMDDMMARVSHFLGETDGASLNALSTFLIAEMGRERYDEALGKNVCARRWPPRYSYSRTCSPCPRIIYGFP